MTNRTIAHDAREEVTPMMRQYRQVKQTCGDAILMFRLGDFYEMFEEDAHIASDVLDLTLTKKHIGAGKTVPLAGIPYHALNNYLFKLTRAGYRVAICEQTEDSGTVKGLLQREVVRTVTPGTLVESEGIDGAENNYLVALVNGPADTLGMAVIDVSTGEFRATVLQPHRDYQKETSQGMTVCPEELYAEISKIRPSEILLPETFVSPQIFQESYLRRIGGVITLRPSDQFVASDQDGYQSNEQEPLLQPREIPLARRAAGGVLAYLSETHRENQKASLSLTFYRPSAFLGLDPATERNLELVSNLRDGSRRGTLLSVVDRTRTAMGARELKQWLLRPLLDSTEIRRRQDAIQVFLQHSANAEQLSEALRSIKDLERLISRISYRTAGPRDLKALEVSIAAIPQISALMVTLQDDALSAAEWFAPLDPLTDLHDLLQAALVDEPPYTIREGGVFREDYQSELAELKQINRGGKEWILELQTKERQRTGISSLKVGFNKVFGYYLEITNAHQERIPPEYVRKQTLVSAERYITSELKEYENKVLTAQERIISLEKSLFNDLLQTVGDQAERIQGIARSLARLDALLSLALIARERGYCRPEVDNGEEIEIIAGRHPSLDGSSMIDRFVPNDVVLDNKVNQLLVITGPNMGGKSTYIRQVALLVLMTQMGSFIPAKKARIGLVDRIFTRVGASDNLFGGQSTFMVEMSETSSILRNATPLSLIVLDEIGRGTATYDGISLAWAIAEFLLSVGKAGVKTLFATHYHELAELEERHSRVRNYQALAQEQNGKVNFVYQIVPGRSDHSYGIHVAELAGIPRSVTRKATRILEQLESGEFHRRGEVAKPGNLQMTLFNLVEEPLAEELTKLHPEEMTPIEALGILNELVRKARKQ